MLNDNNRPIKILTPYRFINKNSWPGEYPVEIFYANDHSEMINLVPDMDVLITLEFTKDMGASANRLKLIQSIGVGYDKIDLHAVPKGCAVTNCHDHEKPMAEWVVMSMIALNRELIKSDRTLRSGSWEMSGYHNAFYPELEGQTLVIVGLGRVSKQVAVLASAFNMRIIAVNRTVPMKEALPIGFESVVGMESLHAVIREADFLLLTIPLVDATQDFVGKKELAMMKSTAHLINVARAETVNEEALYEALKDKQIKGAALDVWYKEPIGPSESPLPSTLPFWELENVIMSPHSSAATDGVLRRRILSIANNVDSLARNEPLQNVVR